MLLDGRLTLGHAKILAGVPDILEQQRLADLVVSQELSVRNLERLLTDAASATPTPTRETAAPAPASAHLLDLEKSLTRQLGLRVQLRSGRRKREKGRLIPPQAHSWINSTKLLNRLGVQAD